MVSGFDGKPKGFCYAEFAEPAALRKALDMSGTQLAGRTVRISVAEPREQIYPTLLRSRPEAEVQSLYSQGR